MPGNQSLRGHVHHVTRILRLHLMSALDHYLSNLFREFKALQLRLAGLGDKVCWPSSFDLSFTVVG